MAFTTSLLVKTVFGDKRVHMYRITADAATQAIDTGLDVVDFATGGNQSASTAAWKLSFNEDASGTAANGYIAITGVASGDELFVNVYGH